MSGIDDVLPHGYSRVGRVHGNLIFGGIANQTFGIREGDVRRSCAITLIVGDDLDTIVLPDTNATESEK